MYFQPPEVLSLRLEVSGSTEVFWNKVLSHSAGKLKLCEAFIWWQALWKYPLNNYIRSQIFVVLFLDIFQCLEIIIGKM